MERFTVRVLHARLAMQQGFEARLRHAVAIAASAALSTQACGNGPEGVAAGECKGEGYVVPTGAKLSDPAIDYIELRREYDDQGTRRRTILASGGTPCAAARDPAECYRAFNELQAPRGWDSAITTYPEARSYLVYTRHGVVHFADDPSTAARVVLPVDNANKAALAALLQGFTLKCGDIEHDGTWFAFTTSSTGCGSAVTRRYSISPEGRVERVSEHVVESRVCAGRRPVGLVPECVDENADVGEFFASVARLEGAAVIAFERLAGALERHGAPSRLVAAARDARSDEVRHADLMAALSERFHGPRVRLDVAPWRVPSLLELAIENEVEGCVRETYGAAVAALQAQRAARADVAEALCEVARDELRHAALSWEIAAWLQTKLTAEERALVAVARTQACADLRGEVELSPSGAVMHECGMPDAASALRIVAALDAQLWA